MRRSTILLDRIATFVVAVLLLAVGAYGILWWAQASDRIPATVDVAPVQDVLATSWWPWAAGVAAVLLVLIGLRWLLAHLPFRRGVARLVLPGSDGSGRLVTDAGRVADGAARSLEDAPGVRAASGAVLRERGQLVVRLRASVEPEADLEQLAAAADRVAAELGQALSRDDLRCRVELTVAARNRAEARVE